MKDFYFPLQTVNWNLFVSKNENSVLTQKSKYIYIYIYVNSCIVINFERNQ
jgi:hypothetical protein